MLEFNPTDNWTYTNIQDVCYAQVDGKALGEITEGIIVFPEYKDLLDK